MRILAASIGNCVHVAGLQAFLRLAEVHGHDVVFLGPAVSPRRVAESVKEINPDLVALSYRLSPETAAAVLKELASELIKDPSFRDRRFFFGGTPPVARLAQETGLFEHVFDGSEPYESVLSIVTEGPVQAKSETPPSNLASRIKVSYPHPLIRHHFGLPDLDATIEGARRLAERKVLDILSIAPDQNAQESFFRSGELDPALDGAGGVPLRKPEDLRAIYEATRRGNYPLLRCYSGTRDLIKWAEMLKETIAVAWGAVPLTWYSELDGRSKRPLEEAIAENQRAIKWYADNCIPVEVNESHQWALRGSGDVVELATAYLAAYNAKALGVRTYVCQFMFDTPKGISPAMDFAKMLAKLKFVESLADDDFEIIRMVRTGLLSLSPSPDIAKGQMAASIYSAMSLKPHIVHVVGFCEADHAATPEDIEESCVIARGAIEKAVLGVPNAESDPVVASRKACLLDEAKFLIGAIKRLGVSRFKDPLSSSRNIAEAVRIGLLDAPDLRGTRVGKGRIVTAIVGGACITIDRVTGQPVTEKDRLREFAPSNEDLDLVEI